MSLLRLWHLTLSDGLLRLSHRMRRLSCERLSEVLMVARLCSRAVQLRIHVLSAAEHAAEVWEARSGVSVCAASLLVALGALQCQLRLSHRMRRL